MADNSITTDLQAERRTTIKKKMSLRDYITLAYFFKTGSRDVDFSECEQTQLGRIELRSMRLTKAEKAKMDEFFKESPLGISFESLFAAVPKVKNTVSVIHQPLAVVKEEPSAIINVVVDPNPVDVPPSTFPWLVDPAGKIEPSNIDARVVIDIIKEKGASFEEIAGFFVDRDVSRDILLSDIDAFYTSGLIENKYTAGDSSMLNVMTVANKGYEFYQSIMSAPELTEEEQLERYSAYVFGFAYKKASAKIKDDCYSIDEITSVSGDKIIADDDPEDSYVYEDATQMMDDLIYLAKNKKIDPDKLVDIFGKKTSVTKKIKSLYNKYPSGMPGEDKFYHSQREAYEDGAIKI